MGPQEEQQAIRDSKKAGEGITLHDFRKMKYLSRVGPATTFITSAHNCILTGTCGAISQFFRLLYNG